MRLASWQELDRLFRDRALTHVTIVRAPDGLWTFTARAPGGVVGVRAQRGGVRTWADPRVLVNTLQTRYGVARGDFVIIDEEMDS